MPGALAGAQLRIVSRSATRSATPKIEAERGRSANALKGTRYICMCPTIRVPCDSVIL